MHKQIIWLLLFSFLLAACSSQVDQQAVSHVTTPIPTGSSQTITTVSSVDLTSIENPARNPRKPVPENPVFNLSLGFDSIRPVYNPEFVNAAQAPFANNELVMGVALGDEAKAYPVTVLRFREMVNDELAGIPILVTW